MSTQDYLDKQRLRQCLLQRLEKLSVKVTVEEPVAVERVGLNR